MISLKKISSIVIASLTATMIPSMALSQKAPDIDSKAKSLLEQSNNYLKKQPFYSFQADISFDDVLPPAFKIQYHAISKVKVRRPNGVFVEYVGDRRTANFYYDGNTLTLWDKIKNVYGVVPTPSTIDATISTIIDKYDFSFPLADFISSNFYKKLTEKIKTGYYVGTSLIGGVVTHHLAFSEDNIDWQIWIEAGDRPLPRKILITYKNLPGSPQYSAIFSEWDFQPLNQDIFTFKPPEEAVKIEFLPVRSNPEIKSNN